MIIERGLCLDQDRQINHLHAGRGFGEGQAPRPQTRLLSVYAEASVLPRREWYGWLGHPVVEETAESLMTVGGFRSEHFSEARLRRLVGDCSIHPFAGIAYLVTF